MDRKRIERNLWTEWKLGRELGRGSFGVVYEIDKYESLKNIHYKSALKVITIPQDMSDIQELINDGFGINEISEHYKSFAVKISDELNKMSKLKGHSNIVSFEDSKIVEHDDRLGYDIMIRMELLTSLTEYIRIYGINEREIIRIGIDICKALEICRNNGILHRDIKPDNIYRSNLRDYKIGDFGISKTIEKTSKGTKAGTLKYMAPEIYNNQKYGYKADMYSLGLVLFWMLNERRMPFVPLPPQIISAKDLEVSQIKRFNGIKMHEPQNGSDLLKAIVLKACEFDPEKRYRNIEDMRTELERALKKCEDEELLIKAHEKNPQNITVKYKTISGGIVRINVSAKFWGVL